MLFLLFLCLAFATAKNRVMPWMCLERCGANTKDIQDHLKQIHDHKEVFSAVSFELFNLGPNSTLVLNDFYQVIPDLKKDGLLTYAMISSFPYPPDFLDWMRSLWNNPEPFFRQCSAAARQYGFTGFNVDFEPTATATAADAQAYAQFLNLFAVRMHKENVQVTVDVASWNPIWNWKLIGATQVDRIMLMSTYTYNITTWARLFNQAVQDIPLSKLGIGLMNPDNHAPLTDAELQERFDLIEKAGIQEVDIWKSPVLPNWWRFLEKFVRQ